jgi:STAM-binding protein
LNLIATLTALFFSSTMSSSAHQPSSSHSRTPRLNRRPLSIAELAQLAHQDLYDDRQELKHYLRAADKYRRNAKHLVAEGDLEGAFIQFAKAATLVLEKLPTHRDYQTLLNAEQRHNLGLVRVLILCLLLRFWEEMECFGS